MGLVSELLGFFLKIGLMLVAIYFISLLLQQGIVAFMGYVPAGMELGDPSKLVGR